MIRSNPHSFRSISEIFANCFILFKPDVKIAAIRIITPCPIENKNNIKIAAVKFSE